MKIEVRISDGYGSFVVKGGATKRKFGEIEEYTWYNIKTWVTEEVKRNYNQQKKFDFLFHINYNR